MKNLVLIMRKSLYVFISWTLLVGGACSDSKSDPAPVLPDLVEIEFPDFVKGLDLSYVNQVEDHNGTYYENGQKKDPFELLQQKGANLVRLRLWHNPKWIEGIYGKNTVLYSGFEDVKRSIQRAKNANMAVNLDFHYSDTWADPGNQDVPEAWQSITDINVLSDSVYNYTYSVLNHLFEADLLPQMVQIGNETNPGMMITKKNSSFPNLEVYNGQWKNFGRIVNAGIQAVRDMDAKSGRKTVVALHVADPKNLEWWFDDAVSKGSITDFDVMGFSFYHNWHTTVSFNDLPDLVARLTRRFNKKLMVLETAYPFTKENNDNYGNIFYNQPPVSGFPYSIQGQYEFMKELNQKMAEAGAIGVIYWEPAWITSEMKDLWGTGSSWENCALFDFNGNITEAANYLSEDY